MNIDMLRSCSPVLGKQAQYLAELFYWLTDRITRCTFPLLRSLARMQRVANDDNAFRSSANFPKSWIIDIQILIFPAEVMHYFQDGAVMKQQVSIIRMANVYTNGNLRRCRAIKLLLERWYTIFVQIIDGG